MHIIKRFDVTEKWHPGFKRNLGINEIVVHGTGGGSSAEALMNWIISGERQESYQDGIGLFHFIIDYDGTVYQIAPVDIWFYHSSCMGHDALTIGVELMNKSVVNKNEYTEQQYIALSNLIYKFAFMSENFRIVGHDYNGLYYSHLVKGCPGNFDFEKLYDMLNVNVHRIYYKDQRGLQIYV